MATQSLESKRADYHAHRDRERRHKKEYYQRHKASLLGKSKEYYAENRDAYKALKRRMNYGVTQEQFAATLTAQGGVCGSCGLKKTTVRDWHLDHDHATGQVRGVLCHHCNIALGHLKDDPRRILALLRYVSRAEGV